MMLNWFNILIEKSNMPPKKNANNAKASKSKASEGSSGKEEKKGGTAVKVC